MFSGMVDELAKLFDEKNEPLLDDAEREVLHARHSRIFRLEILND